MIFDKNAKTLQRSRITFSTNGSGATGHPGGGKKKKNLNDLHLTHYTKTESKRNEGLKCKTINVLEKNVREHF